MDLKTLYKKTGIKITGVVKGINSFPSKKTDKTYWSVDLDVAETRLPINVKLPEEYDRGKLNEYEIVELQCKLMPTFDRKGIEIHALV